MNTPSHFLMTAALRKVLPQLSMPASSVLVGSVAPDVPLYLLSFGGLFYFQQIAGMPLGETLRHMYGTLYFQDPGWIASHSLLHSPVSLAMLYCATWPLARQSAAAAQSSRAVRWSRAARWFQWFLAACLLHSLVDIITHFDDGPVLFWPLDWSLRFSSPISYWDPAHYGSQFALFEWTLVIALSGYLIVPWLRERLIRPA